jgi:hypothetical protein
LVNGGGGCAAAARSVTVLISSKLGMKTIKTDWMKVVKQLLREFIVPALISGLWTLYATLHSEKRWTFIDLTTRFGGTFFLASWALAQVFRIAKQTRVDDQLDTIRTDLTSLLQQLKDETNKLLTHVTGGDSYCFIALVGFAEHNVSMLLQRVGTPVMQDLKIWITDMDEPLPPGSGIHEFTRRGTHIDIGAVTRRRQVLTTTLPLDSARSLHRFNIHYNARNGATHQKLVVIRHDNRWIVSTRVWRDSELLQEMSGEDFPCDENGNWKWWGDTAADELAAFNGNRSGLLKAQASGSISQPVSGEL